MLFFLGAFGKVCGEDVLTPEKKVASSPLCPAKLQCANETTEIGRWECLGRQFFTPTANPLDEMYVEHDCGGVGWGNSIRGYYNGELQPT